MTIENRPAVMLAVRYFDIKRISFGDCLIAALNEAAGADTTYTFDQQAAGLRTFTLVGEEKEEP